MGRTSDDGALRQCYTGRINVERDVTQTLCCPENCHQLRRQSTPPANDPLECERKTFNGSPPLAGLEVPCLTRDELRWHHD